jgi:anti-sigma B factor antagonist
MSPETREHLEVENINDVTVVHFLDDRIDSEDLIGRIGDQLYSLVENREGTKLLLDFSNVRFVSSSMVGKLINLKRKSVAAQGRVKLCSLAPYLRTIFEVSRLDRVFEIYADEQAALDSF